MINTAYGGFDWADPSTISATLVPSKRGPAPTYQDVVPTEPNIQETAGRAGQVATYQDLLRSPNDEKLFEYYATSQLALIDASGTVREIGPPAIFGGRNSLHFAEGRMPYLLRPVIPPK